MIFNKKQQPYTYDINFNYNQKAEQIAGASNYDYLAKFMAKTLAQQLSGQQGRYHSVSSPLLNAGAPQDVSTPTYGNRYSDSMLRPLRFVTAPVT